MEEISAYRNQDGVAEMLSQTRYGYNAYNQLISVTDENGFIDEEIEKRCRLLRSAFVEIQPNYHELWNVQSVIKHPKWKNILELSDEIKGLLYY